MTRGDGPHLDRYGNCGDSDKDGFLHLCMTHSGVANELPSISTVWRVN